MKHNVTNKLDLFQYFVHFCMYCMCCMITDVFCMLLFINVMYVWYVLPSVAWDFLFDIHIPNLHLTLFFSLAFAYIE